MGVVGNGCVDVSVVPSCAPAATAGAIQPSDESGFPKELYTVLQGCCSFRTPRFNIVALRLDLVDLTMTNLNPMFIKDSRDFTDRFHPLR